MKSIFYFTLLSYLSVIFLYCIELVYGAVAQLILGFVQIVIALILRLDINNYSKKTKQLYYAYWYVVIGWFVSYFTSMKVLNLNNSYRIFLFITPMIIGLYFVLVTYLMQKES